MVNQKYEITDIAHEKYPFLHRIRALRDIGSGVKAGDLGGFVECIENLSYDIGDNAWIFDDAVSAGCGCVEKDSVLRDRAIVCDYACVSHNTEMSGDSRAEDDAYLRGARLSHCARASGFSVICASSKTKAAPILSGNCAVYGKVTGDVMIAGTAVVISDEVISNDSLDTLLIDEGGRHILRHPSRDELAPKAALPEEQKPPKRKKVYTR